MAHHAALGCGSILGEFARNYIPEWRKRHRHQESCDSLIASIRPATPIWRSILFLPTTGPTNIRRSRPGCPSDYVITYTSRLPVLAGLTRSNAGLPKSPANQFAEAHFARTRPDPCHQRHPSLQPEPATLSVGRQCASKIIREVNKYEETSE